MPVTGYYQMAVDSADGRVFFSQGSNGSDSIAVTDFSGHVLGAIAEPTAVEGITLSPDGSTLYAALVGSSTVSPAISVISAASLPRRPPTSFPRRHPAGRRGPERQAVGQLRHIPGTYGKAAIGDFDLSAASPALETQPAMGGWYSPPLLVADPAGAGNVLVAVLQDVLSSTAASYDTSADPVTVRAQGTLGDCTGDEYDAVLDVAVPPGGAGVIAACDAPQKEYEDLYGTSGLKVQRSYGTVGTPGAVAFASSAGLVAVGSQDQHIVVYTAGGAETNLFTTAGNNPVADRGLGLNADGSDLFAVTSVAATSTGGYALNIFPDPSVTYPGQPTTPTSIVLTQPAKITVGNPVTISGTLLPAATALAAPRSRSPGPVAASLLRPSRPVSAPLASSRGLTIRPCPVHTPTPRDTRRPAQPALRLPPSSLPSPRQRRRSH